MFGLRIGYAFSAKSALDVGAADFEGGGKAFGTAKGIGFLQQFDDGLAACDLTNLVQADVISTDEFGQFGAGFGYAPALVEGAKGDKAA